MIAVAVVVVCDIVAVALAWVTELRAWLVIVTAVAVLAVCVTDVAVTAF